MRWTGAGAGSVAVGDAGHPDPLVLHARGADGVHGDRPHARRRGWGASRSRAEVDERTRLRFSRISIARCAGSGPAAPRLPRALSSRSVHRAAGACTMDQCPGARDLRPGGSAAGCRMTLPAGGRAGRRAAACCGERAGCRAGPGWPPGLPGRAGARPRCYRAAPFLRDPHLAGRSYRGEQDVTRPPRGPGEDDPGGERPARQPGEAAAALSGVPRPPRQMRGHRYGPSRIGPLAPGSVLGTGEHRPIVTGVTARPAGGRCMQPQGQCICCEPGRRLMLTG